MNPQTEQDIEKDMDAKKEQMLLHQVLEEHINKSPKGVRVETCENCIRLALNKGYRLRKEEEKETADKKDAEIKEKDELIKEYKEEFNKDQDYILELKSKLDKKDAKIEELNRKLTEIIRNLYNKFDKKQLEFIPKILEIKLAVLQENLLKEDEVRK